jgi:ParB family chromosome partitioning protein
MKDSRITMMKTKDIKTGEPFKSLFPPDLYRQKDILEHMQTHGYDPAQPVVIWKEQQVLIEGHTRLRAAIEAEFETIPAVEKSFASEDDALDYAIHCQTERRNLTDADILRLVEKIDQRYYRKNWGGDRTEASFESMKLDSRELTAKIVGIKKEKVSHCRKILLKGNEIERDSIYNGEKTIYQVYCSLRDYKDKVINKGRKIEAEKQTFSKVNAEGLDEVDAEHLNKVCLTLIPHLMKQEAIMEELEKEIHYFKIGEVFDLMRKQKITQEFLASRFVTDFITVIEEFGFEVKRPPEIIPVERQKDEPIEERLSKEQLGSVEHGLLPKVFMLNTVEKGAREIGKDRDRVVLKKKYVKRVIQGRREQAILEEVYSEDDEELAE